MSKISKYRQKKFSMRTIKVNLQRWRYRPSRKSSIFTKGKIRVCQWKSIEGLCRQVLIKLWISMIAGYLIVFKDLIRIKMASSH